MLEFDWVEIPGGSFIYQIGETVELPTFYISRYPVTNVQFQAFIDSGGYGETEGVFLNRLNEFLIKQLHQKKVGGII